MDSIYLGSISAKKSCHFVHEEITWHTRKIIRNYHLHNYDAWKKWLTYDIPHYKYTGCLDNWLHFGTNTGKSKIIEKFEIMGELYYVTSTQWHHIVSQKIWEVVEIKNSNKASIALCGYKYSTK